MSWYQGRDIQKRVEELEKSFRAQKRRQEGIEFPSASEQDQILIIRFNISDSILAQGNIELVRDGLKRLCIFFEEIDNGNIQFINLMPNGHRNLVRLSEFNFSATLGFGRGFFEKLKIDIKNCPRNLKEMPDSIELGDSSPYEMKQTDFIIQLCSNSEDVNSKVFQNNTDKQRPINDPIEKLKGVFYYNQKKNTPHRTEIPNEIYSTICNWAEIVDMHVGFQRMDGTNLLGFNDGISNPRRLLNDIVWTTSREEDRKFIDGTYMVFQKIEHDLNKWRDLSQDEQEKLIGRSKGTGLLLGTISKEQDRKLAADLKSESRPIRERAQRKWKKLYDEQKDPDRKFYDPLQRQYKDIQTECPISSHVRKSNPRGSLGAERHLIYRRGFLFMDLGEKGIFNSGLLFICFQKDIMHGFEYIKKIFLGNQKLTSDWVQGDHNRSYDARSAKNFHTLKSDYNNNLFISHIEYPDNYVRSNDDKSEFAHHDSLNSNRYSSGQIPGAVTRGGGYYFIPPIPNKTISNLSEQFFTSTLK